MLSKNSDNTANVNVTWPKLEIANIFLIKGFGWKFWYWQDYHFRPKRRNRDFRNIMLHMWPDEEDQHQRILLIKYKLDERNTDAFELTMFLCL